MAEKQLLQTRLKSINSLLDNNAKQLELTRSKIVYILTPPNYQQGQEFIEKIKEKRFIKVRERQVRKLNNLINKKEGGITWQSSWVSPATRAFPQVNNRLSLAESDISWAGSSQASLEDNTLSLAESALSQAGRSQAGSSQASLEDSTLSLAESALSQAGSSQASLGDSSLSLAESVLSQAASSQASLVDSTLTSTESEISQAGSSQASPEDNTLSLAESELSQASSLSSLEDGTLQAESSTPPQAVRCSARLWARQEGTP